ncbi:hypothetical protein MRX96_046458 [Rhipicephalus microplus]
MATNGHGTMIMCEWCRGSLSCQSTLAAPTQTLRMLQACKQLCLWMLRVLPTSYAPTENTGATATTGVSSWEFEDACVTSDLSGCASAPVDAPKPEALPQTPLRRSSRVRKPVMHYVPQ